jgi:imidazoleglycerol-phosphate dehydratase
MGMGRSAHLWKRREPRLQGAASAAVACAATMAAAGRSGIRLDLQGHGVVNVETGLPVLDHLLERLAHYARWDLALEVEPGTGEAEVAQAGTALGVALAETLRAGCGYGFASMTSAEALASVVLEISDEPLVVTNVDLTQARVAGLGTDVARRFLERFAEAAGVTLHVRLLNGTDTQHVLEAIFKALGVALAQACSTERDGE